jgi:hypothetical protein
VMFIISAVTIAALIAHKHSTEREVVKKAPSSIEWDDVRVAPRTPARRATP